MRATRDPYEILLEEYVGKHSATRSPFLPSFIHPFIQSPDIIFKITWTYSEERKTKDIVELIFFSQKYFKSYYEVQTIFLC
jgi:hypothetical protein